ncbi:septum formation initiator family protein [Candidatus Daviesbacteria bacterium]|nr:septum formation initiator family protein [Candidatus Daviesbacteria bacterium]
MFTQILYALKSEDRLTQAAELVYKLENKNKQLQEKLSQIQSPQFIEQQARNKLGLSKKGETVVIIPEEKLKLVLGSSQSAVVRLPNWLGWFRVFF